MAFNECLANALNFGNFFKAIFILVAAPLYYIFFSLLYVALGKIYYGFLTRLKKVTLFVQLLNIAFAYIICPLANFTALGFLPSYIIY